MAVGLVVINSRIEKNEAVAGDSSVEF